MRMRSHHEVARLVVMALAMLLVGGGLTSARATPSNSSIRAKQTEVSAASTRAELLSTDLEMRGEELAQIEDAVAKTRQQMAVTQADLEQADIDLSHSEQLLGRRAASIYRNGPVDIVAVFVGAANFQDFMTRLDLMRRIGKSDAGIVATVKDAKGRVVVAQRALETRQAEQLALRAQARGKQSEVAQAYRSQQTFIAGLSGELTRLIANERKREERLAAQAAAKAAQAALEAQAAAQPSQTHAQVLPFDPTKLGAAHPDAAVVAKRYLNVKYLWGGVTPGGFDCSGLMLFSYNQIGISLPRTSRAQFGAGAYIPPTRLDLLEPGDLVFFGQGGDPNRIHHVGMYVGGGDFVHAPSTGEVVQISSLEGRIASRGDYVGACRP